jgi:hypothetical protein
MSSEGPCWKREEVAVKVKLILALTALGLFLAPIAQAGHFDGN